MTTNEALQWADKNCQPEVVERLRSRAVAAALASEVRRLREEIARLRKGLQAAHAVFISNGERGYASACETFMEPNAAVTGGESEA